MGSSFIVDPISLFQLLGTMFENGAMDLVMHYIDLSKSNDARLTFDGLKVIIPADKLILKA